jgi:FKBP-type peptidyl-prolyl cis-trans isomerase
MGAKDALDKKVTTDKSQVLAYNQEYFHKKYYKKADDNKKAADDFLQRTKRQRVFMTDSTGLLYVVETTRTGAQNRTTGSGHVKFEAPCERRGVEAT